MKTKLFYKPKALFGFDIGHSAIKIVQLANGHGKDVHVLGYGFNTFNEQSIKDGIIIDYDSLASSAHSLLTQLLVGSVITDNVAISIPAARSFTRILTLPYMEKNELDQAVQLEAEQYIPVAVEQLYIDYKINKIMTNGKENEKEVELVMVAAPRKIVDSYLKLFDILGLDVALIETSLAANARAYTRVHKTRNPILLVDFGSRSSDINIFDGALRVAGTVDGGGDSITDAIARNFKVTTRQAYILKTRYGLKAGPKQKEMESAISPILDNVIKEILKMFRYYKEREAKANEIEAIVMSGGGANLPGLAEYLTNKTKIKAIVDNPWEKLNFGHLQQPHSLESTIYTTAIGLAFASLGGEK